jgi:Leucine-rich repeat (LRR) protein
MPKLSILDLSSNELATLPDDMSGFRGLRELSLASNAFSTDSVVYSASLLFSTLATIPYLKKLSLSRNKLRGIHSEKLEEEAFIHLADLDFSYNWVDNE